jgi:ubiquinone/menaquinone biosynthesis C-methylase UbiE
VPEARYDAVADFYAAGFDTIDDPASAALLDLTGPPAGLRILDLACGHGRVQLPQRVPQARALARRAPRARACVAMG